MAHTLMRSGELSSKSYYPLKKPSRSFTFRQRSEVLKNESKLEIKLSALKFDYGYILTFLKEITTFNEMLYEYIKYNKFPHIG